MNTPNANCQYGDLADRGNDHAAETGSRLAIALQAADLAEKCFLSEVLFWVAMDRLPLAIDGIDGDEFRFSSEMELCVQGEIEQEVTDSECERAGLPLSPRIITGNEEKHLSTAEFYDQILKVDFYSDDERCVFEDERKQAIEAANLYAKWHSKYLEFLEYYKARIFVDIRDRKINGKGIKLRGSDIETIRNTIDNSNIHLNELPMEEIPFGEWTFSRIDWDNCLLYCDDITYCWVNFDVAAMLSTYPIQDRPSAGAIIQVGDLFVLQQTVGAEAAIPTRRGRPSLPWDQFHLEVATMANAKALPQKKEAAIQHFENWFREKLGVDVSRSSIGQKLTPYYDRFVRGKTTNLDD